MSALPTGVFRSLRGFNYRAWAAGAFVSNVGTWMQRTAQDWLVLTQLTHYDASAVGTVMALQFGPQLLLLPWTGFAADHYNQRKLLIATQSTMGMLALVLGLLTVTGVVQLWHVYVLAFLFGCAAAFDAPVRQTFVAELVGDADLPNAVALNSTSFNAARMIGPAVTGLVIAGIGTGWAFLFNGISFVAVLISLCVLRRSELHPNMRAHSTLGGLTEGFRYLRTRPDLKAIAVMLFLVGTFGLNFPIFISTMAVGVFHANARGYGLLSLCGLYDDRDIVTKSCKDHDQARFRVAAQNSGDVRLTDAGPGSISADPGHNVDLPQIFRFDDRTAGLYAWEFEKGGYELKVRVDGRLVFCGATQMLDAALGGFGLACVPQDLAQPHLVAGRLKRVLADWCPAYPGYHLYYSNRRHCSPAFAVVVDALRHRA